MITLICEAILAVESWLDWNNEVKFKKFNFQGGEDKKRGSSIVQIFA